MTSQARVPGHEPPAGDDLPLGAVLRRLSGLLRPHRNRILFALLLISAWTGTNLLGPFIIRQAIDRGLTEGNVDVLNLCIGAYVLVKASAYLLHRRQILVLSGVGEGFLRDLRVRVFEHLQRLSMPFYDREKAGVIVARMTSDVDSLQELVQQGMLVMISSVLLFVLSIAVLASVSWQLLLVCLVAVPFVVLASIKFQHASSLAYTNVRNRVAGTLARLQEGIAGARVIQAFAREQAEKARFERVNDELYGAHLRAARIQAFYLPVIEFASLSTTAVVVGVGGYMVNRGLASIGDVAFFILTLSMLFEPIQQFSQLFNQVQSSAASLRKLFGLMDINPELSELAQARSLPASGAIEVRDVSFRYLSDGEPVLSSIDLTVAQGEKLALVGPTGAGKSTLAKLMARLYDPTRGSVRFGGVDLRDAALTTLRDRVVVVPQEGFLFHASIRENVRLARPSATDREVDQALQRIGAYARFAPLPDGLEPQVQERGSRLSAGEKQLVSLARAALVDPAVLVLDEATSSLDPGTEQLVEVAMQHLMEGRTVIVIAHRLSTARRADRVAVVAAGRLVEVGTHSHLLSQRGHYASLYATWAGSTAG